jgi:hypothetical protein
MNRNIIFLIQLSVFKRTGITSAFGLKSPASLHLKMQCWDANCSSRFNGKFEWSKCPFKRTLAGLFNPNLLVKTVRLNTLYCRFESRCAHFFLIIGNLKTFVQSDITILCTFPAQSYVIIPRWVGCIKKSYRTYQ